MNGYRLWIIAGLIVSAASAQAQEAGAPVSPTVQASPGAAPAQTSVPPAPEATTPNTSPAAQIPQAPKSFKPSYGAVGESILFPPEEIRVMKSVLDSVEKILAVGGQLQPLFVEERPKEEEVVVPEKATTPSLPPLMFPAFHVASIVYRKPGDWMLWVNGQRVTPKRLPEGITIAAVGPDYVTLSWKADNWQYRKQVWNEKAPLSPQLQRIKATNNQIGFSEEAQTLKAVLRPNQTLATATPLIVEGNHPELAITLQPSPLTPAMGLEGSSQVIFSAQDAQAQMDKQAKEKIEAAKAPPPPPEATASAPSAPTAPNAPPSIDDPAGVPANVPAGDVALDPAVAIPQTPAAGIQNPEASLNDILNAVSNKAGDEQNAAPVPPTPSSTTP